MEPLSKNCAECGVTFYKRASHSKKYWQTAKYCSRKCSLVTTSKNLRRDLMRGKKLSEETKRKIGLANQGEKNTFWKGGRSDLKRNIYNLFEYRTWRSSVFKRDDYSCQGCGVRGCYLECHHIKALSLILDENKIKNIEDAMACDELWNIDNGQTLCRECHSKTDNYGHLALHRDKFGRFAKTLSI